MKDSDFESILISETHWDRAWYLTFQQFRLKLVKLVDMLLDILEKDPEFRTFTFDGQTVVLEDYLEVKPEQKERIKKLVQNGRIDIGPWYVLPDVFLVSGEALIRNLLVGRRIAEEFGRVMDIGYIPDPFGLVSQVPQILSQFGYNSVIFARGTGDEVERLKSEFIWEGSDGSEVLAHWLPLSYGNAANLPEDIEDAVFTLEEIVKQLRNHSRIGTLLLMNGSDHLLPQPHVPEVIRAFNSKHEKGIVMGTLPMFIEQVRKKYAGLARYRGEFRQSKHQNLLSGVYSARVYLKQMNEYTQRTLERIVEPRVAIANILGLPYPADELRLAWKYLLKNHPHDDICGCSIDEVHDDMVQRSRWIGEIAESILDSTERTILDQVSNQKSGVLIHNPSPVQRSGVAILRIPVSDMRYSRLSRITLADPDLITSDPLEAAKNDGHIAYVKSMGFDPSPTATRAIVIGEEELIEYEFDFSSLAMLLPKMKDLIRHLSTAYRIRVNSQNRIVEVWARKAYSTDNMVGVPKLTDSAGQQVPWQILELDIEVDTKSIGLSEEEEHLTVAIQADSVGGLGMKRLDLEVSDEGPNMQVEGAVSCAEFALENNLVALSVEEDGSVTLTDKRNGERYPGLLVFEDTEDVGDEYDYAPAPTHQAIRTSGTNLSFEIGSSGPLVGSVIITGELELPVGAKEDCSGRLAEKVTCDFVTEIALHANSPTVRIQTEFDNHAEDHRLRVLIPTGANTKTTFADSAFDIIERPVRPTIDDSDWYQPVVPTYPMRSFVHLASPKRGLTVTTLGLMEFEVLEEKGGETIALTLVRSVGWLSRFGMSTRHEAAGPIRETPGGQCQGTLLFEYSITPKNRGDEWGDIVQHSEEFLLPMEADFIPPDEDGHGHYDRSFVQIDSPHIRLSAFKSSEDGKSLVLRVWNIAEDTKKCSIQFGFKVREVIGARADEAPNTSVKAVLRDSNRLETEIPGRRIATFLLEAE
ncbi:MAG: hypothetical protein EAX95_08230 [Candidatus Thorarchaeota archaeon]|nr:hypothetical protein [Candidatus Thorarchaeota archaeon]